MDDTEQFAADRVRNIRTLGQQPALRALANRFVRETGHDQYTYHFDWLGLPIIQLPQDIVAIQEIIWRTKPDIIIETGIARGGSLILSASMLHLLNGSGKVIGIDIDIRAHNRAAIEAHPLASRVHMLEGSSIDPAIVAQAQAMIPANSRVMVILDSNHTHDHVLRELELYAPLVTQGCYLLVMDTSIDDMPADYFPNRPWGVGNNPKTAVHAFLPTTDRFVIDHAIHDKLLITVAHDGYLLCVK